MDHRYNSTTTAPIMITCEEAAGIIGCSARTIARMCEKGILRCCKAGNRWRVNRNALMAYIGETE